MFTRVFKSLVEQKVDNVTHQWALVENKGKVLLLRGCKASAADARRKWENACQCFVWNEQHILLLTLQKLRVHTDAVAICQGCWTYHDCYNLQSLVMVAVVL